MKLLALYLAVTVVGYFVGSKFRSSEKEFKWIGIIQIVAVVVLVFTMGVGIGADDRIISSLGSIGIKAAILTGLILIGSVIAVFLTRKIMGFDRKGIKPLEEDESIEQAVQTDD